MSEVARHYEALLASIYSWTLGNFDERVSASESLFRSLFESASCGGPLALDLGCGTGVQTLALSRLGYRVQGFDFSATILEEYRDRTRSVHAEASVGDISSVSFGSGFDAAVCMGDTIAHLPSWGAVASTFRAVHAALRVGGGFVLATRDHTHVYEGDARFLLIRADATQSLTCFVEDAGPQHLRVTDILHEVDGSPPMRVSSYAKLRVGPASLARALAAASLNVRETRALPGGVHVLFAVKEGP
jgi:SAM-dependent methyltransferase